MAEKVAIVIGGNPMEKAFDNARSRTDAEGTDKAVKGDVDYRPSDSPKESCAKCANATIEKGEDDGTCKIVAGRIKADDVCDRFDAKGQEPEGEKKPPPFAKKDDGKSPPFGGDEDEHDYR